MSSESGVVGEDFVSNYCSVFERPATDYYTSLHLQPNASVEEIEAAYKHLWRSNRPDIQPSPTHTIQQDDTNKVDMAFINVAYRELSDPITRMMYDVAMGHRPNDAKLRLELNRLKQRRAETFNMNSLETYRQLVDAEQHFIDRGERGLLIVSARYGQRIDDEDEACNYELPPFVDVKIALQCMAHNGQIRSAMQYSLFALDGFYLPYASNSTPTRPVLVEQPLLTVYYKCGPHLHKAVFADQDPILIPMKEHAMSEAEAYEYELSIHRNSPAQRALKRQRRLIVLYSTLLLLGGTSYFLYKTFAGKKVQSPTTNSKS